MGQITQRVMKGVVFWSEGLLVLSKKQNKDSPFPLLCLQSKSFDSLGETTSSQRRGMQVVCISSFPSPPETHVKPPATVWSQPCQTTCIDS